MISSEQAVNTVLFPSEDALEDASVASVCQVSSHTFGSVKSGGEGCGPGSGLLLPGGALATRGLLPTSSLGREGPRMG